MGQIRSIAAGLLLSATLASAPAGAQAAGRMDEQGYYVYADVVEVSPRYGWHDVTEPVRECIDLWEQSPDREVHTGYYRHYRGSHRYHEPPPHTGHGAAGLVGGLIGGVIGHQFGGGNGKTALTIAGAVLGASIARDHVRRRAEHEYPVHSDHYHGGHQTPTYSGTVRRCTESEQTRRVRGINGYDVTYRYQGATFHKWVHEHPGDVIRVRVDVEPLLGDASVQ